VRPVQLTPALRLAVWAGAVILFELALFAFALAQLTAPVRGGDGPEYLRLASNLVHHGVFSDSLRAASPTVAPRACSACASARPIPLLAPVTMARVPSLIRIRVKIR